MSYDRASFEDWVNAITKPVIGLLLGLVLGGLITLAVGGSLWLAGIMVVLGVIFWFGVLLLDKLDTTFTNWLFGGSGVRPAANRRTSPGQSWPAVIGRYGLIAGIALGCLAELLLPQSVLNMVFS